MNTNVGFIYSRDVFDRHNKIDAGLIAQSDDVSLEPLEGDLGNSLRCSGQLVCHSQPEPETGGDDDYAEVVGNALRGSWAD